MFPKPVSVLIVLIKDVKSRAHFRCVWVAKSAYAPTLYRKCKFTSLVDRINLRGAIKAEKQEFTLLN